MASVHIGPKSIDELILISYVKYFSPLNIRSADLLLWHVSFLDSSFAPWIWHNSHISGNHLHAGLLWLVFCRLSGAIPDLRAPSGLQAQVGPDAPPPAPVPAPPALFRLPPSLPKLKLWRSV
jgi:hypothetical protein